MQADEGQDVREETGKTRGRHWRKEDAREALEAQANSGLSVAAFAKQKGISASRLHRWQRQLAGGTSKPEAGSSRVGARAAEMACAGAAASGVRLIPAVAVGPAGGEAAVVVRVDGVVVEVTDTTAVPARWIASLIGGLRSEAS